LKKLSNRGKKTSGVLKRPTSKRKSHRRKSVPGEEECAKCGTKRTDPDILFCEECGNKFVNNKKDKKDKEEKEEQQQQQPLFCEECGFKRTETEGLFCEECGATFVKEEKEEKEEKEKNNDTNTTIDEFTLIDVEKFNKLSLDEKIAEFSKIVESPLAASGEFDDHISLLEEITRNELSKHELGFGGTVSEEDLKTAQEIETLKEEIKLLTEQGEDEEEIKLLNEKNKIDGKAIKTS